jgi:hypothetical protein
MYPPTEPKPRLLAPVHAGRRARQASEQQTRFSRRVARQEREHGLSVFDRDAGRLGRVVRLPPDDCAVASRGVVLEEETEFERVYESAVREVGGSGKRIPRVAPVERATKTA